jgi:hypothetical protein
MQAALRFGMPSELDRDPPQSAPDSPLLPPLKLSALDLQTLHGGLVADADQLAELDRLVLNTARLLAGPDRAETRVLMLAKAISITRAKCVLLESLLDARLAARDERDVLLVSKVLDGLRRHLVALLAEHRLAGEGGRRTPVKVSVGHVGAVNVMAVAGAP